MNERNDLNEFVKQFVRIAPVVMEGEPEAHNVSLHIGNQGFCVTKYGCENLEEAEWTRDMLCVALESLIRSWTTVQTREAIRLSIDDAMKAQRDASLHNR